MQFSHLNDNSGKAGKFALIAGLHVLVGILFVQSLQMRSVSRTPVSDPVTVKLDPERPVLRQLPRCRRRPSDRLWP